jgi:hypothetical protein
MGIFYNTSIVKDGLVLCLDAANQKSYPGSGTTWTDLSGRGNNGTLTNGPTYSAANGGSLVFNGINNTVTLGAVLSGNTVTPFTLMAWTKTSTAAGWQTVVGTAGTYRQIGFSGTTFYWGGNAGAGNSLVSGGVVTANIWYHLAFTFDGTTGYGYLNTIQTTGSIGSNGGTIGNSILSSYGAGEYLNGNISNVQIYNRALSAAEIDQNFQATRDRYGI